MTDLLTTRGAVLVGPYRYCLTRDMNRAGRSAAIVMVNPSTADAETDDHTIRKLYGFAERNDIARFAVVNKFAHRAKDIRDLRTAADPVGPENDEWIRRAVGDSDVVILAWGRLGKLPAPLRDRWRAVHDIIVAAGHAPLCLGRTQDGHPLHPLTLDYGLPLQPWRRPL